MLHHLPNLTSLDLSLVTSFERVRADAYKEGEKDDVKEAIRKHAERMQKQHKDFIAFGMKNEEFGKLKNEINMARMKMELEKSNRRLVTKLNVLQREFANCDEYTERKQELIGKLRDCEEEVKAAYLKFMQEQGKKLPASFKQTKVDS